MQRPCLRNRRRPFCADGLSAASSPSMNASNGVWSEISVFSYSLIASPKNSEKFASITGNWFGRASGALPRKTMAGPLPDRSTAHLGAFHHFGRKACFTRQVYRLSPASQPSAGGWRPVPGQLLSAPRTLSSPAVSCRPSGARFGSSIFRPTSANRRPRNDISRSLTGGASAWLAPELLRMSTSTNEGIPSVTLTMRAVGSRSPTGFTPLNVSRARPSQKLRWLNTALTIVGVFRGSTLRTGVPCVGSVNVGFGVSTPGSIPEAVGNPVGSNVALKAPDEDTIALLSNVGVWNGKSLSTSVSFAWTGGVKAVRGGTARVPGLSWFFERLSAPAWKWQLAHDCPSLPTCSSQNSALPSITSAPRSRTYWSSVGASAIGTVLSDAVRDCATARSAAGESAAGSCARVSTTLVHAHAATNTHWIHRLRSLTTSSPMSSVEELTR